MKTRDIIFSVLILLISCSNTISAQEKFLILTKDSIAQFPMIDDKGKSVSIKPINNTCKLFLAKLNPESVKIKSDEYIFFSIYRFADSSYINDLCNYETQDINLSKLFEIHRSNGVASLSDKEKQSFYHFLLHELNKSSQATRRSGSIFKKNQPKEFCCKEDFKIEWDENIVSQRVSLYDIENNNEIWVSSNINTPYVNDSIIDLSSFDENQYYLRIQASYTNGTKVKSYDYDFSIRSLIFLTKNHLFPIADSVKIAWKSAKPITEIQLREKNTGKILWTSDNYEKSYWRYAEIKPHIKEAIKTGLYYELGIQLNHHKAGNEYIFDFKTTFSKKEYDALR